MDDLLKEMFPSGEWGLGQRAWMVKDGVYFCAAADIIDGEIVLTELGKRLVGATAKKEVVEEIAPVEQALKLVAKKSGLKAPRG